MKLKLNALILIVIFLFSCTLKEKKGTEPSINSFEELISIFSDPPADYRPAPLWVWNNDVSEQDIDRYLHAYKDAGIGGAFLHPRYGMMTEYLSDRWFELVKHSRDVCKDLGLKLWLYDENSYPSGFAGGRVNEQMPESYNQGTELVRVATNKLNINENDRVKYIFKNEDGKWKDITATYKMETDSAGQYIIFYLRDFAKSSWYGGHSYVDLLVKGVTEKFIEITYTGYKNSVGEDFGTIIPGTFSDEPHVGPEIAGRIRWTPDLASCFREMHGYDLESNFISMVEETGDWMKLRHDYYATILDMFIKRWSIPMSTFCKDNKLIFTGHYWEHYWPNPFYGPDNMAMYPYHTMPGIDLLFNSQIERPDQFGNIRSVKELSSVANQFGYNRTLCETYGGAGWELRFDEMKRLGDWAYVLGVNFMNPHLSFISLMGDRKHDYPQSFAPHTPYWKQYHYMNDYFGRLSAALSSGKQRNRILILEPTTTAWMYFSPQTDKINKRFYEINPAFRDMLSLLEIKQVEYDLGSEHIIRDYGKVSGKNFLVNLCSYEIVILPPYMDNIEESTYRLLKKFVSNGGKVIQLGDGVKYISAVASEDPEKLSSSESWIKHPKLTAEIIDELLLENDFVMDVKETGGELYHHRRRLADGQIIFFSNFSLNNVSEAEVMVKGSSVEELCAQSGQLLQVKYEKADGKVSFSVKLYPSGSYMVYIHDKKNVDPVQDSKEPERILLTGSETRITRMEPNIFNQDYLKLKVGTEPETNMFFKKASDAVYRHFGFKEGNPWFQAFQFKTEILDQDKNYKKGDSFEVAYNFDVAGTFDLSGIKLVVERPYLYTVSLNGVRIQPVENASWIDPDFRVFTVGKILKKGNNEVRLVADPFSVHCEIEPVYLLGNFRLESVKNGGWRIIPPKPLTFGSWKAQGMPFYGQSVKYSKTINVDKSGEFEIELPSWSGTVATININGEEKGIIMARPGVFKTNLTEGENIIDVIVTGSLKNTLGPHHGDLRKGVVRPYVFQNAPAKQPEGDSYQMIDYGLMEDFKIFALKK